MSMSFEAVVVLLRASVHVVDVASWSTGTKHLVSICWLYTLTQKDTKSRAQYSFTLTKLADDTLRLER